MPLESLDFSRLAILLDVDGTLLDIAPTPLQVQVPSSLPRTLAAVRARVGGALALVSGRPISELDTFFAPLKLPAIGGHGAEMRPVADGDVVGGQAPPLDPAFKQHLKDIAVRYSGVIIEDKGYSLALHYRQVPKQGLGLIHDVRRAFDLWSDGSFELLTGKAVLEIKFAGFNKGTAVRDLMTYPPFAGRAPIFIGDDRTDEDAFAVVPDFNGQAMSVGRRFPGVADHFQSPSEVRHWLERLSETAVVPS